MSIKNNNWKLIYVYSINLHGAGAAAYVTFKGPNLPVLLFFFNCMAFMIGYKYKFNF